ncbi:hypothetical protein M0638_27300 [Roseomonas sp. NAR14]|uniref:Uncharacterized protein n=1 Tax=Roseomonas acroporae TaxID=2937791 RepID=A0A9X2BWW1_9PROT|nr:hypothetical protein [Roseomonas acroporae]MCK8788067.1 hypothetical protein [Roseomonas acroporae]
MKPADGNGTVLAYPGAYWSRARAAEEITMRIMPIAQRTLMTWTEVPIVILNRKACALASQWLAAAVARRDAQLAVQGAIRQQPPRPAPRVGRQAAQQAADAKVEAVSRFLRRN